MRDPHAGRTTLQRMRSGMTRTTVPGSTLRFADRSAPGYRRLRRAGGFRYIDVEGQPVRDVQRLERIRALAIPPAWTDVWICPDPRGHIQAVGRDARDRVQYRYHPDWRRGRDQDKYQRVLRFARRLPRIRQQVERDLARPGLPREKVLALVVRILELTHMRVGNAEYARVNRSYGLTTLRRRHARVAGTSISFVFRGKSGREHRIGVRDRRLAGLIRRLQELPGQELFSYQGSDDAIGTIRSEDVNDYLRAAAGTDVTAKDFRTWAATVLAFRMLAAEPPPAAEARAKRQVRAVMTAVSEQLGNTVAVCRASYVDPRVVDAWQEGTIARMRLDDAGPPDTTAPPTDAEEAAVIRLLARQARAGRTAPRRDAMRS